MTEHNIMDRLTTSMAPDSFWRSVDILLKKPHVVNKKVWGCKTLFRIVCKPHVNGWKSPVKCIVLESTKSIEEYKKQLLQELQLTEGPKTKTNILEVNLIELLPKTYDQAHAFQLVFLNKDNISVTFCDVTSVNRNQKLIPNFTYCFQLNNNKVHLDSESNATRSHQWLREKVLPQIVKWGEETILNSNESLTLVCCDKYYQKYNDLKLKYGKEMVKIWPECTDPSKFVYEDVAIAAYLLLLWEDERFSLNLDRLQTFVDLGCGNGLLVYILAKEGHKGVGIDVRKRQIWDMYTEDVKLEERTITPSDSHLFPEADWIIGNHSDELTPWIPVIAARSSYKCNFFLLPCCAYNFDGTKYQRQNSSISQYAEYLKHIQQLCEDCGFKTNTDRLKIPSTKRICLVGRGRSYLIEKYDIYCNKIQQIICSGNKARQKDSQGETPWLEDFKAREATERVRNCTQIDKNLINSMVKQISCFLLEGYEQSEWSVGKTVEIKEVVQLISQDKLNALKSECGGLQTLLKNNHHIFKVQSGKVQLRYPKTVDEVNKNINKNKNKISNIKVQQKPCWFYNNHPKGCPLEDTHCSFLHINILRSME